jgi:hypothetical protein
MNEDKYFREIAPEIPARDYRVRLLKIITPC